MTDLADFPELAAARRSWASGRRSPQQFRDALAKRPRNVRALIETGRALGQVFEITDAERCLEEANEVAKANPKVLPVLAASFAAIAREARAMSLLEGVSHLSVAARAELAQLYERAGRMDDAMVELRACAEAVPNAPEPRLAIARLLRRGGDIAEATHMLDDLIDSATPRIAAEAWAERAALYEGAGDPGSAAEAMAGAHGIVQGLPGFETLKAKQNANDAAISALRIDPDRLSRWQQELKTPSHTAHLTGFPRSGTTLLERILDAHPGLHAAPERAVFTRASLPGLLRAGGGSLSTATLDAVPLAALEVQRQFYRRAMAELENVPLARTLLLDKNPNHTGLLPALLRLQPDAPVIVALRDPRDVVTSCVMRLFHLTEFSAGLSGWESACRLYATEMGAWLRLREVLPPKQWVEIRYEDLVGDLPQVAGRALGTLGLEWQDTMGAYRAGLPGRTINSPSHADVRKPIHGSAIGRWRGFETQLAPHMHLLKPFLKALDYHG